jgi:hypothetical protein
VKGCILNPTIETLRRVGDALGLVLNIDYSAAKFGFEHSGSAPTHATRYTRMGLNLSNS